jgi:hypothetical protein
MRWALALGGLVVLVIVGALLVFSNPTWVYDVNGDALGSSLSGETNGTRGTCKQHGSRQSRWRCWVEVDPGSGVASKYHLVSDDSGCWTAKRTTAAQRHSRGAIPVSGCAGFWDYAAPNGPGLG